VYDQQLTVTASFNTCISTMSIRLSWAQEHGSAAITQLMDRSDWQVKSVRKQNADTVALVKK